MPAQLRNPRRFPNSERTPSSGPACTTWSPGTTHLPATPVSADSPFPTQEGQVTRAGLSVSLWLGRAAHLSALLSVGPSRRPVGLGRGTCTCIAPDLSSRRVWGPARGPPRPLPSARPAPAARPAPRRLPAAVAGSLWRPGGARTAENRSPPPLPRVRESEKKLVPASSPGPTGAEQGVLSLHRQPWDNEGNKAHVHGALALSFSLMIKLNMFTTALSTLYFYCPHLIHEQTQRQRRGTCPR